MTLKHFKLTVDNHFVAMEYYGLILNRTFLVVLTKEHLVGIKVNGLVAARYPDAGLANAVVNPLVIDGDLDNPRSYMKQEQLEKLQDCELDDGSVLKLRRSNFMYRRSDIVSATHNPAKKAGMGYYPHDGRVIIRLANGRKRELIVLGNQSGGMIAALISAQ